MTQTKMIILRGNEDLLAKAVEIFLSSVDGWNIVQIAESCDADIFIQEVEERDPSVVIICQGKNTGDMQLPLQLIQKLPHLKVVTVNLESNMVEVYKKQKVLIKNVADLLSIVEN